MKPIKLFLKVAAWVLLFISIILIITFLTHWLFNKASHDEQKTVSNQSHFEFIEEIDSYGDTSFNLVYDINTGIEYILIKGYGSVGICPHYDSDGTIMNYYDR